jgi:hypothetical protein
VGKVDIEIIYATKILRLAAPINMKIAATQQILVDVYFTEFCPNRTKNVFLRRKR